MTLEWVSRRLRRKRWYFIKIFGDFISKMPFYFHSLQNSLKSLLSSGSFTFLWNGTKSNPFSRTLISLSDRTLPLKLKTVSEQKQPLSLLSGITSHEESELIVQLLFWSSSKISNNPISCIELNLISLDVLTL